MPQITLEKPWTYRTPEKTIRFTAGTHGVFKYIADRADAEGATVPTVDPLDASIPDLATHLGTVDEVSEIDRLIANEVKGKTRAGALEALHERKAELGDPS